MIKDVQSESCCVKNNTLVWRKIGDEVVIIHDDEIYSLKNASAVFLWGLIDGKTALIELTKKLAEEFEINIRQAEADVNEFITALGKLGLIQGVNRYEKSREQKKNEGKKIIQKA